MNISRVRWALGSALISLPFGCIAASWAAEQGVADALIGMGLGLGLLVLVIGSMLGTIWIWNQ
jgi:hypothetical protein